MIPRGGSQGLMRPVVFAVAALCVLAVFQAKAQAADQAGSLAKVYALRDQALNDQLRGNYGLAYEELKQACLLASAHWSRHKPVMESLYFELATAAELAGKQEEALEALHDCLACKPDHVKARLKLARLLARAGKLEEAVVEARKAVSQAPGDAEAEALLNLLLTDR